MSVRSSFAAASARPVTRALRAPAVAGGSIVVALRLVPDSTVAGVLVVASALVLGWGVGRHLPAIRASLPEEVRVPTVVIVRAAAALGGFALGAPLLAAVERRHGPTWAAAALVVSVIAVSLHFGRNVTALRRDADAAAARAAARRSRNGSRPPLLEIRGLDAGYGRLQVLHGADLEVGDGELVALLGVNGAGKSTLLRAVSGLHHPTAGAILFGGEDITYLDAEERVRRGIVQVPGGRAVFGPLSVEDNLRSYAYGLGRAEVEPAMERAFVTFPRLAERRDQAASTLSGGEQQMLGLAKAVMLQPRLLLIDELSLGLAPVVVGQLLELVRGINAAGTAVVLVEQSVNVALSLAEHAFFMERGAVQFDGRAEDLLARDDLLRAVFLEGAAGR